MKPIKLYQTLSESQLKKVLISLGTSLEKQNLVDIFDDNQDLYGDFIIVSGYKFKKTYGKYQCFETPTEKHKKLKLNFPKAANDYYKKS